MDERGFVLKVKQKMPEWVWRSITRPAAFVLSRMPIRQKYHLGLRARRHNAPYRLIEPGDCVFQIGVPSDLLSVGRTRAAMFLLLVQGGTVVVMEPIRKTVVS